MCWNVQHLILLNCYLQIIKQVIHVCFAANYIDAKYSSIYVVRTAPELSIKSRTFMHDIRLH